MRLHFRTILLALLALGICTGSLQATISISPTIANNAITLTCDAVSGAAPLVNVGIVSTVAAATVNVTMAPVSPAVGTQGIVGVLADGRTTGSSQTVGTTSVNFGFHLGAGCKNATNGSVVTITFTSGTSTANVAATVSLTNTNSTSLTAAPNSITLTCQKGGSAGPAQSINITSTAAGGTGFYVDTTVPIPQWMAVTSPVTTSSNWATVNPGPTAIVLTPQTSFCSAMPLGLSSVYNLTLANPPAKALVIPVYIQVANQSPVSVQAPTVSLTFTKGTLGSGTHVNNFNVQGTLASTVMFSVNTASLPQWLTVSPTTGLISTTQSVSQTFTASDGAVTLPVGSYSTVVHYLVPNYLDQTVTVNLTVQTASSSLSIVETAAQETKSWTIGDPYPSFTVTAISTDAAIAFKNATVASNNAASVGITPRISPAQGVAYSFGTPITVTFDAGALNNLLPGQQPTWLVTLTNGIDSTQVTKVLTLNVFSPGARISAISPGSLPLNPTSGTTFNITLSGSGFVGGGSPTTQTVVGVLSGGFIWTAPSISSVTVISPSTLNFVVTVQATPDQYFPFGTGGPVTIAVCNPNGTTCNTAIPAAQATLNIGGAPVVQAVTSASTYIQSPAGAYTAVAPYDIVSVFGTGFCNSCSSLTVMNGQLSSNTMQYSNSLSPDNGAHVVSVQFWSHSASPTLIATAPLLFATNTQINLLVPDAVWAAPYRNQLVDLVVSAGPAAATVASPKYPVIVNATDTGVFTIGGDGLGGAAALDLTASNTAPPLVTSSVPAIVNVGSSDQIELYVTGLGEPDATTTAAAWPGLTCLAPSDYVTNLSTAYPSSGITTVDGLVLQGGILATSTYGAPCFKSSDTPATTNFPVVTIGGLPATVTYAGWVSDSVAGLYQINVTLPTGASAAAGSAFTAGYVSNFKDASNAAVSAATLRTGASLPVRVTSNGVSSQPGVTLAVQYALSLSATHTSVSGASASFVNSSVVTTISANGSGTYTFQDLASAMPTGFQLNAAGTITVNGVPPSTSGPVTVTITVTDTLTTLTKTIDITFNVT